VLKQVDDILAPFIVELFNRSLSEGHFPAAFKEAFITPMVKDATDCRVPIELAGPVKAPGTPRCPSADGRSTCRLPTFSIAAVRLSTETAVLRVLSDILQAVTVVIQLR